MMSFAPSLRLNTDRMKGDFSTTFKKSNTCSSPPPLPVFDISENWCDMYYAEEEHPDTWVMEELKKQEQKAQYARHVRSATPPPAPFEDEDCSSACGESEAEECHEAAGFGSRPQEIPYPQPSLYQQPACYYQPAAPAAQFGAAAQQYVYYYAPAPQPLYQQPMVYYQPAAPAQYAGVCHQQAAQSMAAQPLAAPTAHPAKEVAQSAPSARVQQPTHTGFGRVSKSSARSANDRAAARRTRKSHNPTQKRIKARLEIIGINTSLRIGRLKREFLKPLGKTSAVCLTMDESTVEHELFEEMKKAHALGGPLPSKDLVVPNMGYCLVTFKDVKDTWAALAKINADTTGMYKGMTAKWSITPAKAAEENRKMDLNQRCNHRRI